MIKNYDENEVEAEDAKKKLIKTFALHFFSLKFFLSHNLVD